MAVKLKTITEKSWLVIGDTEEHRIGLLTEIRDMYTLTIKGEKKSFLNKLDVNKYFCEDVFKNIVDKSIEEKGKTFYINGYPVDFDNPQEVIIKGNNLPLFSKKSSSDIYYSAGYYCLKFPKNWMPAYCPKYSTLQSYEFAGPFKTDSDMRIELNRLRKIK